MRLERYQNQWWIGAVLLFATSLFFSRWFWPDLTFLDGDSFYHIKITELLSHGIPRSFPWLPYTILNDVYIDHHLLYHAVLFPFIHFFGPFAGAKIATVLLAAAAIVTFYLVLRGLRLRAPFFFSALLLLAPGFMFRMNLAKAPAFSVILFLLGIYFLLKRRSVALGILAFIYVWAYNLWPLLGFMVVVWILSRSFLVAFLDSSERRPRVRTFFRSWFLSEHMRPLVGVVIGTIAGMIINPYFPTNLLFYWHHIVQIGIVGFQTKINVGAEWYPPALVNLIGQHAPLVALFGAAFVFLVLEARRRARLHEPVAREELLRIFGLFMLTGVFFVLTARSRRMVEYFAPMAVLTLATITTMIWPSVAAAARSGLALFGRRFYPLLLIPAAIIIAILVALPVHFLVAHREMIVSRFTPHYFSGATTWLEQHVPAGSVVFHDRWDHFPMLFLGDDRLRYINGMDSTFFYVADPERYKLWRSLIEGEYAGDVVGVIRDRFESWHVILTDNERHKLFRLQLELAPRAELVYEDAVSAIFLLKD